MSSYFMGFLLSWWEDEMDEEEESEEGW